MEEAGTRTADKLRQRRKRDHIRAGALAVELAEAAADMIRAASADTDDKARRKLLATTRHQHHKDVSSSFLGMDLTTQQDVHDLADELDDIDRSD